MFVVLPDNLLDFDQEGETVIVAGYKLAFEGNDRRFPEFIKGDGHDNVAYGLLFDLTAQDLEYLDTFQGMGMGLHRKARVLVSHNQQLIRAIIYVYEGHLIEA